MGKETLSETTIDHTTEQNLDELDGHDTRNESQSGIEQLPVFGYDLIREYLLNEILGQDAPQLLYWGGKQLARKFPLNSVEEICEFFRNAGWGSLEQIKLSRDESLFELSGEPVLRRLSINTDCHFQLEAGFLAQQFQYQKRVSSEAVEERKKRSKKVSLIVKWDLKDVIG
ncbi:YslB family protein [Peribacillus kribbensis]|uniref:YslB family protein n=1 Tax=Peribacillus kribbensis TaxID=356658 RepID=UPI0004287A0B|nr:YslB family protein [Peribacillus kribbensis]